MDDYRLYSAIRNYIDTLSIDSATYERLIRAIAEALKI